MRMNHYFNPGSAWILAVFCGKMRTWPITAGFFNINPLELRIIFHYWKTSNYSFKFKYFLQRFFTAVFNGYGHYSHILPVEIFDNTLILPSIPYYPCPIWSQYSKKLHVLTSMHPTEIVSTSCPAYSVPSMQALTCCTVFPSGRGIRSAQGFSLLPSLVWKS